MARRQSSGRRATLHDVARLAKVSPMTVSNFVNDKLQFMSDKTRERVAMAVTALNYRPQTAGRNLRYTRSFSVGMIIVDQSPHYLSDGYTTQVVSGLGNCLNERGYTLQLEGVTADRFEDTSLLKFSRTDGLCIMLSGEDADRARMLGTARRAAQPLIVFLEDVVPPLPDTCSVVQSERDGGRMIAEHVLERGARNLMICRHGINKWKPVDERCRGIADAAAECSEKVEISIVDCGDAGFEAVQGALASTLDAGAAPDAVMGMSDQIGIAALRLLTARGMRVPDDVMVTGFNGFDFWRYSEPLLTTVRSPGYELGKAAGSAMMNRVGEGAFETARIELPVELVVGETT